MEGTRPDPANAGKLPSEVTVKAPESPRRCYSSPWIASWSAATPRRPAIRLVSGGKPAAGTRDFYVSSSSSIIGDDKTRGASRPSRARLLLRLPRLRSRVMKRASEYIAQRTGGARVRAGRTRLYRNECA